MTDKEKEHSADKQQRAEEFLQVFKKGADFTHDLLKENERLRFQVVQIEEQMKVIQGTEGSADSSQLLEKIQKLEGEKNEILGRIKQVEE